MRVFVAGATGALGRCLLPRLVANGHDVTGMTRTPGKRDLVHELGARPVVVDALDGDAVRRAIMDAGPDAIIHELTALPTALDPRHFERDFAATNRLRTEGTDHLLAAGRAADVRRFIAQSYAGWPFARVGGPVKTEDEPLDPSPPAGFRSTLDAIRHVETAVTAATWTDGIVLRYGGFYGPGTSLALAPPTAQVELVRKRQFPVVGGGTGIWSFVHIEDAAAATALALERARPGIYNVVDDEPAPVSEWLPALAAAVGAKPPRRLPRWIGRLVGGEALTVMMTEVRGASNGKARRELDWQPRHASWREGFVNGLR